MTKQLRLGSDMKKCLFAAVFGVIGLMAGAGQAAILYSNDFSSTGLPNATGQFALGTGVLDYQQTAPTNANPVGTASAQVAGLGSSDFVVSTTFTVNATGANTGNSSSVGAGLFGTNAAFTGNAANPYYLADFNFNGPAATLGHMRIVALGDTSGFTAVNGIAGPVVTAGSTYELRLTGAYSGGTLTMTLQTFDELGNPLGASGTATDTSPLTGQFFGYRNRLVANSGTTSISYDSFSVTEIPEPTSITLLVSGMVALGARSSRRSKNRRTG